MAGYFQKTTSTSQAVPKIKHSSDYSSLQSAFDDLTQGDTLFINKDYVISDTLDIINDVNNLAGNVQIIGLGGVIQPASNGTTNPIIRIKNNSGSRYPANISLSGLRIKNTSSTGSGSGVALQICDDLDVGNVFHIRLENLRIENFDCAVEIINSFDIVVDNIFISQCNIGIHCNTNKSGKLTGQIKIFGGISMGCVEHISFTASTGLSIDHLEMFGFTCGHLREGATGNSTGIRVDCPVSGLFVFGSHFEDLGNGFLLDSNSFVATTTVLGNKFIDISNSGIDYSSGAANTMTIMGNSFSPSGNPLIVAPNPPYLVEGFAALGNSKSNISSNPQIGILESFSSNGKSSYRLATYTESDRPTASSLPPGSVIFNITTNMLNIVNDTSSNWVKADGTTA